jgi:hypothetical protein
MQKLGRYFPISKKSLWGEAGAYNIDATLVEHRAIGNVYG